MFEGLLDEISNWLYFFIPMIVIFALFWLFDLFNAITDVLNFGEWYHLPLVLSGLAIILGVVYIFISWWVLLVIIACLVVMAVITIIIGWREERTYLSGFSSGGYGLGGEESEYEQMTVEELKDICRSNGITGYSGLRKSELIALVMGCDDDKNEEKDVGEKVTEQKPTKNPQSASPKKSSSIPTIRLTDIAGLDEAKQALEERVILPLKHKDIYEKYDKSIGGGILLFGLPGTGKTMFAQAVATELDAKFFNIKCSDIESKWIGESERNIKKLFTDAKKCERAVIFFDEFDSLGRRRSAENEHGSNTVQEILTQMQGVEKHTNMLLIVAATNTPWRLDGALLRPGRFSEKIYIPLPDKNARSFILNRGLKKIAFGPDVQIDDIAESLEGCNGADVAEFCEKVKMLQIRKEISKDSIPTITKADVDKLLSVTKSSVLQRDIDNMNEFLESIG